MPKTIKNKRLRNRTSKTKDLLKSVNKNIEKNKQMEDDLFKESWKGLVTLLFVPRWMRKTVRSMM